MTGSDAIVVDPGGDMNGGLGKVLAFICDHKLAVRAILCTHLHFDHIYGVAALHRETGAPYTRPRETNLSSPRK